MRFAVESKNLTELLARRFESCGGLPWLCRLATGLSPRRPGFSFRSVFWDSWWMSWHWARFSSQHFDFALSVSMYQTSVLLHCPALAPRSSEQLTALLKGKEEYVCVFCVRSAVGCGVRNRVTYPRLYLAG